MQWLPDKADEITNTMVFTSPSDHFVDVRIFQKNYPFIGDSTNPKKFEEVFEWAMTGVEKPIVGTNKIEFVHEINSHCVLKAVEKGVPLEECPSDPDVGAFFPIAGSEDRKETGSMLNPTTGKVGEYVEIWRSLDPNQTRPDSEARETEADVESAVYQPVTSGFSGKLIRLGNWVQGILYDTADKDHPLSVVRLFWDDKSSSYATLIKYGRHEFPDIFEGLRLSIGGIEWQKI